MNPLFWEIWSDGTMKISQTRQVCTKITPNLGAPFSWVASWHILTFFPYVISVRVVNKGFKFCRAPFRKFWSTQSIFIDTKWPNRFSLLDRRKGKLTNCRKRHQKWRPRCREITMNSQVACLFNFFTAFFFQSNITAVVTYRMKSPDIQMLH